MGEVILVRHAAPAPDALGRWIGGGSDPTADPAALAALRPALRALAGESPPARLLVSPLRRARETAALLGRPIIIEPRLRERHFGTWEGRRTDECLAAIDPRYTTSADRWLELPIPAAEPVADVIARTAALWDEIAATRAGWIWCVAHAGTIRGLLAAARDVPLAEAFGTPIEYGSWIRLPLKNPFQKEPRPPIAGKPSPARRPRSGK